MAITLPYSHQFILFFVILVAYSFLPSFPFSFLILRIILLQTSPFWWCLYILYKTSPFMCHLFSPATFLQSTTVLFSHSLNSSLQTHNISCYLSFSHFVFYVILTVFILYVSVFIPPTPTPPIDSFTGCGMRCVISEWHVSQSQGNIAQRRDAGGIEPGEVGCVGAVAGSQGLEEVERRGWGIRGGDSEA